uniref:PLC-like phosphodiesterase n=2 Tax=Kalanchoe fedtschenkoi TaxID=63787 RepID=A0A7N0T1E5_KALFE
MGCFRRCCAVVCFVFFSSLASAVAESSDIPESDMMTFMDEDSNGSCKQDCEPGTTCFSCGVLFARSHCVRSSATDPFKLVGTSLPFNKYAFLTTHNSFAISGESSHTGRPRFTLTNQDESVTEQLESGVRALMLDTYDFLGDVWLCHSFKGKCHNFTAFEPARDTLAEVEAFLSANPSAIVTLILEDYVTSPNGLTNVFKATGLMKYWFPLSKMPRQGGDWPLVKDMIAANHRLIVFTSIESKEQSEGIAYQWNFMVENQFGDGGLHHGNCPKRAKESAQLADKTKSLVLINHFPTIPVKRVSCKHNSKELLDALGTCYVAAGDRWANFIAVDYFERSDGGGAFQALDMVNGKLLCGEEDVHQCAKG